MTLYLGLLTAHLISDFVVQSGFREARSIAGMIRHMLVVAGTVAVLLWGLVQWHVVEPLPAMLIAAWSVAVGLLHIAQDQLFSSVLSRCRRLVSDSWSLAIDQAAHMLVLLGIGRFLVQQHIVPTTTAMPGPVISIADLTLKTLLLTAICTGFSAVLIARLLAPFQQRLKLDNHAESPSAGLWIGICERLLLALAIGAGSEVFPAVGLVFTAKSIFRFRELENRVNAEYYLLGSLVSISVAVLVGLAVRVVYPEAVLSQFR